MNVWKWAALFHLLAILPCGYLCFFKKDPIDRLIGLATAGVIEILLLVILAQDENRPEFYDVALTLCFLTFGGGMVFVRFLERWL